MEKTIHSMIQCLYHTKNCAVSCIIFPLISKAVRFVPGFVLSHFECKCTASCACVYTLVRRLFYLLLGSHNKQTRFSQFNAGNTWR